MLNFTVVGKIRGKGRPRFIRKTGIAYTPADTVNYESWIRHSFLRETELMFDKFEPFNCPLELSIGCFFARPKSHYNSKGILKKDAPVWHTGKPDSDNVIKALGDSLNHVAWHDDSAISVISFFKRYSDDGNEYMDITINDELIDAVS